MVATQYKVVIPNDATPIKRTFYLPLWLVECLREEAHQGRRSQGDIIAEMGRDRYQRVSSFFSPDAVAKDDIEVIQEAAS